MTTPDTPSAHTSLPWSCYQSENTGVGWLIQGKNTRAEPLGHEYDPATGKREPVYQHIVIGEMDNLPEAGANAEFIVRACNAHGELLGLVRAFQQECSDQIQQYRDDLKEDFGDPDDLQEMVEYWTERRNQCDAAIANASGRVA